VRRDCGRVTARILLATGGSPQADLASLAAVERAEATGSELHVVYVGRLPNFQMQDPDVVGHDCRLYDEIEQEARERLRKLTWRVGVAGGTVAASHLRIGWPGRQISRLGEEIGADMIVVGSRGRLRRALTGSVSEAVVRHAPCSVLVVRPSRGSPAPPSGPPGRVLLYGDSLRLSQYQPRYCMASENLSKFGGLVT
jgi:nucleotide-binding universal stress UspA family protein